MQYKQDTKPKHYTIKNETIFEISIENIPQVVEKPKKQIKIKEKNKTEVKKVIQEKVIKIKNIKTGSESAKETFSPKSLFASVSTKNPDKFAKNEDIVKQLAKMLQKRIAIRPDPSVLTDADTAERKIKNIIPKDAEITNIYFPVK